MHGSPLPILADIGIPNATECLRVLAPFLVVLALISFWRGTDIVINRLFPNLEWERKLGWLNFAAQRRADAFMRWLGYFVYAILAAALLGIVWAAQGLSAIKQWSDIPVLSDLLMRIPVLLVSLGFWLFYLGYELIPKMRGQYEEEELEKFRAEQRELEGEESPRSSSRLKTSSPRFGSKSPGSSNRTRPRR